jgi:hypothetical protein
VSSIYRHTLEELIVGKDLLYHSVTFGPRYTGPPCIIALKPEIDYNKTAMGLPPVTSAVFLIANKFW